MSRPYKNYLEVLRPYKNYFQFFLLIFRRSVFQFPFNSHHVPLNFHDPSNNLHFKREFLQLNQAINLWDSVQHIRLLPLRQLKRLHGIRFQFITLPSLYLIFIRRCISCPRICLRECELMLKMFWLIILFLVHRCGACNMLRNGCVHEL